MMAATVPLGVLVEDTIDLLSPQPHDMLADRVEDYGARPVGAQCDRELCTGRQQSAGKVRIGVVER